MAVGLDNVEWDSRVTLAGMSACQTVSNQEQNKAQKNVFVAVLMACSSSAN